VCRERTEVPKGFDNRNRMVKRVFAAVGLSSCSAVLLGVVFAASTSGRLSLNTLRLPGVLPVMFLVSTSVGVLLSPLVWWASKSGAKSLVPYGVALFCLLLIYVGWVTRVSPVLGLYGAVLLAVGGLILIGFIHR
jgi:hypothetical protein